MECKSRLIVFLIIGIRGKTGIVIQLFQQVLKISGLIKINPKIKK